MKVLTNKVSIIIDNQKKKKTPVEADTDGGDVSLFWAWDALYLAL